MTLSEFARGAPPLRADTPTRVTAGVVTALIYASTALLLWLIPVTRPDRPKPEIVAILLQEPAKKAASAPESPMPELIKPRPPERPAPPVFRIDSGAPLQAPLPLPATALESPMIGGASGGDTIGQAGGGTGGNGSGAGGGCLDPYWMAAVTGRVRQFFYYPPAALARRTTGVVTIRFGVRRNGQIDRLEIGKSSGDDGLDQAALDILRKAQPLPPIPARMQRERVDGELPVNFGVRNFAGQASAGSC